MKRLALLFTTIFIISATTACIVPDAPAIALEPSPDNTPLPPSTTLTRTLAPTSTLIPPTATVAPSLQPSETPTTEPTRELFALGDKWLRATDGMEMVYVPVGTFEMGSKTWEADAAWRVCRKYRGDCMRETFERELPLHMVTLDGFWIDRTEVTNVQYRLCVEAGACQAPTDCYWDGSAYGTAAKAEHPVVCIDWYSAQAYCAWAGARLPTEAEWEYAARGEKRLTYPWGNRFECERGNFVNVSEESEPVILQGGPGCDEYEGTAPVGSFPEGASWCGALDMAGNAWEWVADWFDATYYARSPVHNPTGPESGAQRGLRGGCWFYDATSARSAIRDFLPPQNRDPIRGFRCAGDAEIGAVE